MSQNPNSNTNKAEQPEHLIPKWHELVKTKREALGETQGEFGKRFGISHSAISDLERGVSDPRGDIAWWLIFARPEDTGRFLPRLDDRLSLEALDKRIKALEAQDDNPQ